MRVKPVSRSRKLQLLALQATPLRFRWLWTPLCLWRGFCLSTSTGRCAVCQQTLNVDA